MPMLNYEHLAAHPLFRKGSTVAAARQFEGHKLEVHKSAYDGRLRIAGAELQNPCGFLDISWLKSAASKYQISPDPKDYIIVELPIVTADIPNRNLDCFPFEVLSEFNHLVGRITYQTLIGKPTFIDHQNNDPAAAKGVIFDAVLRSVNGIYRVKELAGFDRTKDPQLVRSILSGERNGYSMGALAGFVACSVCGHSSDGRMINCCRHIVEGKGKIFRGKLVYENCNAVNFVETSSVGDPADITAVSNDILQR